MSEKKCEDCQGTGHEFYGYDFVYHCEKCNGKGVINENDKGNDNAVE